MRDIEINVPKVRFSTNVSILDSRINITAKLLREIRTLNSDDQLRSIYLL